MNRIDQLPHPNGNGHHNGHHPATSRQGRSGPAPGDALSPEAMQRRLVSLAMQRAAQAVALDLPPRLPPGSYREEIRHAGYIIIVMVQSALAQSESRPRADPVRERTECEQDLITVLKELGATFERRFTRTQIENELACRNILWGATTVGVALAHLVKNGLLINHHDRRGYGLPTE